MLGDLLVISKAIIRLAVEPDMDQLSTKIGPVAKIAGVGFVLDCFDGHNGEISLICGHEHPQRQRPYSRRVSK